MRIVDLSLTLGPKVEPVPGHPRVTFKPIHTHEEHQRSNTFMTLSIHTGTHIDAPYHFHANGKTIDQIPLDKLIGPAYKVDVRSVARPGHALTVEDLKKAGLPPEEKLRGKRLLLHSGWVEANWNSPKMYEANPHLAAETAEYLVKVGIAAFASDFSVDGGYPYPCHQILLGAEICLIENLVNLDQVPVGEFMLVAMPVKIEGGNGGMARVAAFLEDWRNRRDPRDQGDGRDHGGKGGGGVIRRVHHIGIIVDDLDKAMRNYETLLGIRTERVEIYGDGLLRIAFLPVGETLIELIQPLTDSGMNAEFLREHGPGIHHIALEVEDIEASLQDLKAKGVEMQHETPQPGAGNTRIAFINAKDFGGALVELTEEPASSAWKAGSRTGGN